MTHARWQDRRRSSAVPRDDATRLDHRNHNSRWRRWGASLLLLLLCVLQPATAADNLSPSRFDHFATGFPLLGAHASVVCESCHGRAGFSGTPRRCAGCHNNVVAVGKNANHIDTSEPCDTCHGNQSLTWEVLGPFDHSGVTGNCARCHNGVKSTGKGANHIRTTDRCEACHLSFLNWSVDRVDHAEVLGTCSSCHNNVITGGKPPDHPPTTLECDRCHASTTDWSVISAFDHTGIVDNCARCHGVTATPKSRDHVPTGTLDCSNCHRIPPEPFAVASLFDHSLVVPSQRCDSCHNGAFPAAPGKSPNHIPTPPGQDCGGSCHNTISFSDATFDHAGIVDNCARCHGVSAPGKTAIHLPTPPGLDCGVCHRVPPDPLELAALFNHSSVSSLRCSECHNGRFSTSGAEGKTPNHFVTTRECDACHTIAPGWPVPATLFRHTTADFPGDHNPAVTCDSCHTTNTQVATWRDPAYKPACAGCHAGDFDPAAHPKTLTSPADYSVAELKDCTGACHVYATPGGAIAEPRDGQHRPNDAAF